MPIKSCGIHWSGPLRRARGWVRDTEGPSPTRRGASTAAVRRLSRSRRQECDRKLCRRGLLRQSMRRRSITTHKMASARRRRPFDIADVFTAARVLRKMRRPRHQHVRARVEAKSNLDGDDELRAAKQVVKNCRARLMKTRRRGAGCLTTQRALGLRRRVAGGRRRAPPRAVTAANRLSANIWPRFRSLFKSAALRVRRVVASRQQGADARVRRSAG